MNLSEFEDSYDDEEVVRGNLVSVPISDLSLREPIAVDVEDSIQAAVEAMNGQHIGCVLVLREGRLAGIFTERDLLTKVVYQMDPYEPVESAMTPNPETLESTASVAFALNKMSVGGYRHIPVVDRDSRPLGVVSIRDVVDYLVELFPETVLNLPPTPEASVSRTRDGA